MANNKTVHFKLRNCLYVALFLTCFIPSCFAADEWTKEDTAYQTTFLTLMAVDWQQTKEIARNPKYREGNFILGENPDQNTVDAYFLTTAALHTVIAYYLPQKYRRIWQCVFIGMEAGYVAHNYNIGVRIQF